MSAWSKDFSKTPKDKPFLVRQDVWDCPAVMKYVEYPNWKGYVFVEQVLADIAGGLDDDEVDHCEWAPVPE